jgi:hypothetical protein
MEVSGQLQAVAAVLREIGPRQPLYIASMEVVEKKEISYPHQK